jgi:hypothetical protein
MFVPLGYVAGQIVTQLASRRFAEQREADYLSGKRGPAAVKQSGQLIALSELGGRAKSNSVLSRGKPNCGLRQMVGRSLPPGARLPLLR